MQIDPSAPLTAPSKDTTGDGHHVPLSTLALAHPALQRLQKRLAEGTDAGDAVTAYSRMHHRHNRS